MKKLGMIIAAVASLSLATPVFACPGHDEAAAPKTAEKAKDEKAAPAKEAPKAEKKTETAKAKQAPRTEKKPEKVSQK